MFKKLQNLLFEEEEVIEEEIIDDDDEEVEIEQPKPRKVKKAKPVEPDVKPIAKPVAKPVVKPAAKPIVDDRNEDTVQILTEKKPSPVVEEKPKPLGIQIDELQDNVATTKPASGIKEPIKPAPATPERTRVVPSSKPEGKAGYEFSPVISPIFGVDDTKDVEDIIPTSPKKKITTTDSRIGTVISPMYGVNKDAEPDAIRDNETVGTTISPFASYEDKNVEKQVPNLTLDDILANREVESNDAESTKFFKTDDFDKTIVMNNRNISLFDDDDDDEN